MSMFDMTGRVVLINGASRGIGEAMALAFGELGATVLCSSRRLEAVQAVASAIEANGGKAKAYACHTGQVDQVDALFEAIKADFGRLDVLINNAATNPYFGPMVHAPESAFDKTFEVNVKGFFMMAQRAGQIMVDQGKGSIINVASIEGISPSLCSIPVIRVLSPSTPQGPRRKAQSSWNCPWASSTCRAHSSSGGSDPEI